MAGRYIVPRSLIVSPYGKNPLVEDLGERYPTWLAAARAQKGAAPTLFAMGDLVPYTASGADAALLSKLPYTWRHAAAAEPSAAHVLAWLEEVAANPEAAARSALPHDGIGEYVARMERWMQGVDLPDLPEEQQTYPDGWLTPTERRRLETRDSSDRYASVKGQG